MLEDGAAMMSKRVEWLQEGDDNLLLLRCVVVRT